MKYNFDQIIDRRSSNCIKWKAYSEDVLPMWVADMDFLSPEPVIRALRERAEHGFFGYPEGHDQAPCELVPLRHAIVEWLAGRHGWHIQPEWLVFVPGVVTGFNLAGLIAEPQQAVLVQTPVYPPMLSMAKDIGIQRQEMELTRQADGTYFLDLDRFEAAFTSQTRLFLLCNPHNPVGKVFSAEDLSKMAEICLRRGVTMISDEIHFDLVYPESHHIPLAALDDEIAQNTITLTAPSKTFNLAGLQCSYAVIPNPELRKWYIHRRGALVPWVNEFGLQAALAAYSHGHEWLEQLLVYLQSNRDYLMNYVQNYLPGVKMGRPEATYLAWLDCRGAGIQDDAYRFFLKEARVALVGGEIFGKGGEGFVRMNFGCPRSQLTEALERMRSALEGLRFMA